MAQDNPAQTDQSLKDLLAQQSGQPSQSNTQKTDPFPIDLKTPEGSTYAIGAILVFVMFLPFIISMIRNRFWLQLLSLLFCLGALAAGGLSLAIPFLGGIFGPIVWSSLWGMGLICGVAAAIDGMAEHRNRKALRRQEPGRAPMAPRL